MSKKNFLFGILIAVSVGTIAMMYALQVQSFSFHVVSLMPVRRNVSTNPNILKDFVISSDIHGKTSGHIVTLGQSTMSDSSKSKQISTGNAMLKRPNNSHFLVDTPGCNIPDFDPYDKSVLPYLGMKKYFDCFNTGADTHIDGQFLRLNRSRTCDKTQSKDCVSHCRYQKITRSKPNDNKFAYSKLGTKFGADIRMEGEFVRVRCYNRQGKIRSTSFRSFILPKGYVEKRCDARHQAHIKAHQPTETLNVILLGIDSVSRLNSIRLMPRTRQFLLHDLQAIELAGYNKLGDNTFPNMVPLTSGKTPKELPWNSRMRHKRFNDYQFLWDTFSKAGYRTHFAEDAPHIALFNYRKKGFRNAPADYYYRTLALAMEREKGIWSQGHHCVQGKLETEIMLDYLTEFSRRFSDKPHFSFTFITRLTHSVLSYTATADRLYLDFLTKAKQEGRLNNTALFFFSDHGIRFGDIRRTLVGKAEERLPLSFVVLPDWFGKRYPELIKNLQINSHRLTTAFDVHETVKDILYFDGKARPANLSHCGISLFREIPPSRTCLHAGIPLHWCMCSTYTPVPLSSIIVRRAAQDLVQQLNRLLNDSFHVCAKLSFKTLHGAVQVKSFESSHKSAYQVTLETDPGGAMFEGTLKYDAIYDRFSLAGDISRINIYGNQSHCVEDYELKKFCYCRK